jgi:hypothetical protein
MSAFTRTLVCGAAILAMVALGGCRLFRGNAASCHKPGPQATAENRPALKIPPGLKAPDTGQALRIPELKEPEPPARGKGDPCLDAPPPFSTPKPAATPAA